MGIPQSNGSLETADRSLSMDLSKQPAAKSKSGPKRSGVLGKLYFQRLAGKFGGETKYSAGTPDYDETQVEHIPPYLKTWEENSVDIKSLNKVEINYIKTTKKVARTTAPEPLPKAKQQETIQPGFADVSSPKAVGAFLRAARERANMTQTQVAEKMGTDHSAVRKIEYGKANSTLKTITSYAEAVGLSLSLCLTANHQ